MKTLSVIINLILWLSVFIALILFLLNRLELGDKQQQFLLLVVLLKTITIRIEE